MFVSTGYDVVRSSTAYHITGRCGVPIRFAVVFRKFNLNYNTLHRGLERSDQDLVSRTPINCPCVCQCVSVSVRGSRTLVLYSFRNSYLALVL